MSEIKWSKEKLIDLGEFARGRSKHRPRNDKLLFENGKYPLVQTGDIRKANLYIYKSEEFYNDKGLKQSKLWPTDTLCITIAANIAETALLGRPMCFPDSIVGFNAYPKKSNNLFVHYVFELLKQQIQSNVNGSIQKNINIEFLQNFELMVPPLEYQNKISELLKNIDQKIANNDAISKELESMAKTIYDYWFLQFEFPDKDGKPYKSNGGKMVWNDQLKQEIPENWKVGTLDQLFNITMGTSPKGNTLNQDFNGIEFYQGSTDFGEFYPKLRVFTTNPIKKVMAQDVLLSVRAPVGALNLAQNDCSIGRGLAGIHYDLSSLYAWNKLKSFQNYFDVFNNNGTTFGSLSGEILNKLIVIIPDTKIIKLYASKTNLIEKAMKVYHLENQQLKSLRDFLLPLLMNGQVIIED